MKTITNLISKTEDFLWNATYMGLSIMTNKKVSMLLMLIIANVSIVLAQNENDMANSLWSKATIVYQLMSVLVLLALLFFGGKAAMEGMKGQDGAWLKFGTILAIGGIWFFAIPPFIKYLATQKGQSFSGV